MTLADDLNAPPLARRVAEIIQKHAAALDAGSDWATMAALRVLVEVGRGRSVSNGGPPTDAPPLDIVARCEGLCVMGNDVIPGGGLYDVAAYPHPECPRHGVGA